MHFKLLKYFDMRFASARGLVFLDLSEQIHMQKSCILPADLPTSPAFLFHAAVSGSEEAMLDLDSYELHDK